jgi:hypothetical protein
MGQLVPLRVGIAIYTGHDTKVMMNSSAAPSKRSSIERGMDTIVIAMLMVGLHFLPGGVRFFTWPIPVVSIGAVVRTPC